MHPTVFFFFFNFPVFYLLITGVNNAVVSGLLNCRYNRSAKRYKDRGSNEDNTHDLSERRLRNLEGQSGTRFSAQVRSVEVL